MRLVYRHYDCNGGYVLKSFTGVIVDTLGRHRHFVNGKPVQAPEHNPTAPRLGDKHYLEELTPSQRKKLQEKINARLHGDDLPADYEERYSKYQSEYVKPTEDKREKEDEAIEKAREKERPHDDDELVEREASPIKARIKRELKEKNKAKLAAKRAETKEKAKAIKQAAKAELAKFDAEYDAVYSKIDELDKQWKAEVAKGNANIGEFILNGPGRQLERMQILEESAGSPNGVKRAGMSKHLNDVYMGMKPDDGGDVVDKEGEYFEYLKSSLESTQDDAQSQLQYRTEEENIQKLDNELEKFIESLKDEDKFEEELDRRMEPFEDEIRARIEAESSAIADKWAKKDEELQAKREVEDEAAKRKYGIIEVVN